jgi:NAD binding domain of 6-phosphogluconate dehydrogenase
MAGHDSVDVGWVGAGVMGAPVCGHLLSAGYRVKLYTWTKTSARTLLDQGATWCSSPAEVLSLRRSRSLWLVTRPMFAKSCLAATLAHDCLCWRHPNRHDDERAPPDSRDLRGGRASTSRGARPPRFW